MKGKLEGKVAVITGGTSGIGLAAARLFHAEGARVVVTGSNPATVEKARAELRDIADVVQSDASDIAQVRALFEKVKQNFGGLDVLFLNAGISKTSPLAALDEALFDEVFRINVKGPWLALGAALPVFRRGGAVVLNTSMTNRKGMPGSSAYSASKAALRSMARTAAAEFAEYGVRVNAVSPGPTDSGIIAKGRTPEAVSAIEKALIAQIPLRRLGRPEEIARAALFLASEDSSFMTGEEIVVDGGMTSL
ncbi:SDR family oxidoreductase [Pyxidicoccus parkwayensis]|uniref:SDR family oxidoreductase n=1 Tax=Pyxidicoccus parkwayensis TaxID=2813578 RepID=A0ABX7P9H4_9BACT|nr:SDR family oxidoreductase [Pyxidicoccus parkwaysis]QSQ27092.1 SDR family oxidoreductase [Pyxidicoccus parkwaysis]